MPDLTEFVEVYSSTTGAKQSVPSHYLDHPVLSKGIRKTPLQKAADTPKTPAAGEKQEKS